MLFGGLDILNTFQIENWRKGDFLNRSKYLCKESGIINAEALEMSHMDCSSRNGAVPQRIPIHLSLTNGNFLSFQMGLLCNPFTQLESNAVSWQPLSQDDWEKC